MASGAVGQHVLFQQLSSHLIRCKLFDGLQKWAPSTGFQLLLEVAVAVCIAGITVVPLWMQTQQPLFQVAHKVLFNLVAAKELQRKSACE